MRKYYLISIIFLSLTSKISPQNYFPLEVGNRWDYFISGYSHGGNYWNDTLSIEVIGEIKFNTNKDYYILSKPFLFSEYLCSENDSLYYYDTADSLDCLIFTFNQSDSSTYYSCGFDSLQVINDLVANIFGIEDTFQRHSPPWGWSIFELFKLYGLHFFSYYGPLQQVDYSLSGCIISGVTFGELLVSIKKDIRFPINYSLSQNYPNPFNPTTTINYQIPGINFVTIKVYDVLGNEVVILINEEKDVGNYEVEFDGKDLPSGVYFYTLKAGSFVETKKMVLMK